MAYTEPIVWVAGQQASATELNKINENIRALKTPPLITGAIRSAAANITATSTSYVLIDNQFQLSLTTTGGALRFDFNGMLTHSVAATLVPLDIIIDGTTYVSSMTTTPVTNGLWSPKSPAAAVLYPFGGTHTLPAGALDAGNHTFQLLWKAGAAGTITLGLIGYVAQFVISE